MFSTFGTNMFSFLINASDEVKKKTTGDEVERQICCFYAALVFIQTSFPKVSQVGIRASSLGSGGSFRLVNLHTNWRQERAGGTEPTISSVKEKEHAKRPIVQARFSQSISVMFKYSALVLTQTSFPKVSQVGIRASSLGYGGSFRLMNLRTNWRQERATMSHASVNRWDRLYIEPGHVLLICCLCCTCFYPNIFPEGQSGRYQGKQSWLRR